MRILQILPRLQAGGVETVTLETAKFMAEQGHTALVASNGGRWVATLQANGGHHIQLPVHRKGPVAMVANALRLARVIRQHGIEVLHARSRAPAWSCYLASRWCIIPWITTYHAAYGQRSIGKKLYNSVMTKGHKVIAPSLYIAQHIKAHYPSCHPIVIHEGVDTALFDPDAVAPEARQQFVAHYHLVGKKILTLPGRLTRLKGHLAALQILSKLPDDFILCMTGEPDPRQRYHRQLLDTMRESKLERRVCWLPSSESFKLIYACSDLILVPSLVPEAFGRVIAEAQSMAKVVIASCLGAPPEIIQQDQTGWCLEPMQPEAWVRQIEHFFRLSHDQRLAMGSAARQRILTHFSLEAMGHQTLQVYRQLLEELYP